MKQLLIEDNPAMQTSRRRSFERRGVQVLGVEDGARALALCQASLPDAMLLDLSLAGMDGPENLIQARAAADAADDAMMRLPLQTPFPPSEVCPAPASANTA